MRRNGINRSRSGTRRSLRVSVNRFAAFEFDPSRKGVRSARFSNQQLIDAEVDTTNRGRIAREGRLQQLGNPGAAGWKVAGFTWLNLKLAKLDSVVAAIIRYSA